MQPLRISAVSYLNTFPFVFGLKESGILHNFTLELDVPSVCADKFKRGLADIALVPVGVLPELSAFHYLSDFCIGATGEVKTVLLLSKVPLEKISRVSLDFDSHTSVQLVKVLAEKYWQIEPEWVNLEQGDFSGMQELESVVAIGDKTFGMRHKFPYVYDLAEAWIYLTGLPFVFAVWVSGEILSDDQIQQFSDSLSFGISHKSECLEYFRDRLPFGEDSLKYLEENISYHFDDDKRRGLDLFLRYIR
jgi:chorismate dehydratase